MAMAFKTPELALAQDEARLMAEAAAEVQKHYPPIANEKALAWGQLVAVMASLYGTRAAAIYFRTNNTANVQPMTEAPKPQTAKQPGAFDPNAVKMPEWDPPTGKPN